MPAKLTILYFKHAARSFACSAQFSLCFLRIGIGYLPPPLLFSERSFSDTRTRGTLALHTLFSAAAFSVADLELIRPWSFRKSFLLFFCTFFVRGPPQEPCGSSISYFFTFTPLLSHLKKDSVCVGRRSLLNATHLVTLLT